MVTVVNVYNFKLVQSFSVCDARLSVNGFIKYKAYKKTLNKNKIIKSNIIT